MSTVQHEGSRSSPGEAPSQVEGVHAITEEVVLRVAQPLVHEIETLVHEHPFAWMRIDVEHIDVPRLAALRIIQGENIKDALRPVFVAIAVNLFQVPPKHLVFLRGKLSDLGSPVVRLHDVTLATFDDVGALTESAVLAALVTEVLPHVA